jgi:hypothetical protein
MSLIRKLATVRTSRGSNTVSRYDSGKSFSYVLENGTWIPSWESSNPPETKKADVETGEDQKGE